MFDVPGKPGPRHPAPNATMVEAKRRARRLLADRVRIDNKRLEQTMAVIQLPPPQSPEEEDAHALIQVLDPELQEKLAAAIRDLPGDQGKAAKISRLMNIQVRHQAIVRLFAQGMHPDRIARSVGVSRSTVDSVVKGYLRRRKDEYQSTDMDTLILLMAEGYLEDIDKLTDVISNSRNGPAVVGAVNARQMARQKYIDLLADFGFVKRAAVETPDAGKGDTYNQYVVVDAATVQEVTRNMLRAKRHIRGLPPDEQADNRLSSLVVRDDDNVIADPGAHNAGIARKLESYDHD